MIASRVCLLIGRRAGKRIFARIHNLRFTNYDSRYTIHNKTMSEEKQLAKITIRVPKGCRKTALSVDALDKRTSDLAWQTFIYVGDQPLLCRSFKVIEKPDGKKVVMLEVMEECFEVVEAE
jgi:hypothetical protein